MEKIKIVALMVALVFVASAFRPSNTNPVEAAIESVTLQFHNGLTDLAKTIDVLITAADVLDVSSARKKNLQDAHLQTRLKFKKVEFLLEYFDRYSIKKTINGAPLLSVEPNVPEVHVMEPQGLQVLDELVYGDDIFAEKKEIIDQASQLKENFKKIQQYQRSIKMTHRFIFEASRRQLIRIYSLGLTGFDTPGSVHAIPEAHVALQSIQQALDAYLELAEERRYPDADLLRQTLEGAISYLANNTDFDTFDRMFFLRRYVDPLYDQIYQLQTFLQIETSAESNRQVQSVNEEATSIFAADFLNKSFYANMDYDRPIIKKRIALGKMLFFDPILSSNNERSCASCHQPEKAFSDGLAKSLAMGGNTTIQRNAPTLINSVFAERYFYDLREPQLERQIKHVVLSDEEFSTNFFEIIDKLSLSEEYKSLFVEAYPDYPKYVLSKYSISDALAAYVTSLSSFNSPVDKYIRREINEIDPDVIAGYNLFMGKAACGTCHFAPTFNGTVPPIYDESESEVLGVPNSKDTLNPIMDTDLGRSASRRPIDQTEFYRHSFKTVTVRNIAKTAPYMHNGVYDTLEEVIDFYNKGGGIGLGIDVPYQTLPDTPLNLSDSEKAQLVAFMEALTDEHIDTSRPERLPTFEENPEWNDRKIGGIY